MNDIFDRNHRAVFEENDNFCAERIASVAEKAFGFAVDTSADIDAIKELTPDDGFRLKLETIKAVTYCEACGKTYETVRFGRTCPYCQSGETYLVTGNQCIIKEIEAEENEEGQ